MSKKNWRKEVRRSVKDYNVDIVRSYVRINQDWDKTPINIMTIKEFARLLIGENKYAMTYGGDVKKFMWFLDDEAKEIEKVVNRADFKLYPVFKTDLELKK